MDALPSPRPRTPRHCTAPDAADTGRASSWRGALLLTVAGVLLTGLSVQAQAQKPTPAAGSSQPAVPSTAAPNPANAATPNPAAPGATAPSATAPAADRGQSPSQSPQTLGSAPAEQSSFPLPGLTRQRVRLASVGVPLSELQRQIEAALGVPLVLSAGAADVVATGEFSGADGMAFLRDLATRLRLDWALGRGAVHLAPQGTARTVVYNAPTVTVAARTAVLAQREFEELGTNIRVVNRREEVAVSGIGTWVNDVAALRMPVVMDFVQRTLGQLAARRADAMGRGYRGRGGDDAEPMSMMVFRLNNAYVDDKRVTIGSTVAVIPGVASLFRQFTGLGVQSNYDTMGGRGPDPSISRVERLDPLAGARYGRAQPERYDTPAPAPRPEYSAGNHPAVIADSRMNALIVRNRASLLESYRTLVEILDRPADMVQLDAFVVDIKATRVEEFGLGLSWAGSGSINATAMNPGGGTPNGGNVILQAARGAQLLTQIRALESTGDTEILTVPSVVTLNNLEATFSARQNFYVRVTGNQDASLTKVTAETVLKVTPLVSNAEGSTGTDRRIRLLISIQDGSVDASPSAVVDNLPRTLENQLSTQAVVRGGETLVIGGQVVRKRVSSRAGLPFLKNIPVLGFLASSRSDDYEQYIRVYVVRPRLLGIDSTMANAPVEAGRADPLVHSVLGTLPTLIRGSGLSPRGPDAPGEAPATKGPVVVPVPRAAEPLPPPPAPRARGSASADDNDGARGGKTSRSERPGREDADDVDPDWDSNDPIWKPPQNSPARMDPASQRSRAPDTVRIVEQELQRAEKDRERFQRDEPLSAAGREKLARAESEIGELRRELARVASAPAPVTR